MSDAAMSDMQRITRLAAGPREPGDSTKAAIARAARRLQLTYRRTYTFWYGSPDAVVRATEADRLRAEEMRILASRRIRLEQEIAWIKARLNARESGAHGISDSAANRAAVGEAAASGDPALSAPGGDVDNGGEGAGTPGLITDPRQEGWRW